MFTLGLAGGLDPVHEQRLDTPENYTYEGAAVLLEDGVVVAALEQERLDRIKHSNKFPVDAIRFCLDSRGLTLGDLGSVAYYADEQSADALLTRLYLARPDIPRRVSARGLLHATLTGALGGQLAAERLRFYEHRTTHAACAMHQSGWSQALVYVIDNAGGLYAARRAADGGVAMTTLGLTPPAKSVQKLCHAVLPFLGLGLFEEHKALALAATGDDAAFRSALHELYDLLPDGDYRLHLDRPPALLDEIGPPRAGAPLTQRHHDLAASLQRAMEEIVLHVVAHYRAISGLRNLCVAGGMAENVATNARLMESGTFAEVFVHPVAYDSGCALGAALLASQDDGHPAPPTRISSVQWAGSLPDGADIAAELSRWTSFVRSERRTDAVRGTAEAIASGALVAWLEGRGDFGSHALGGRNVFARPSQDGGERLQRALDRPETYRAPALVIREADLHQWCELPETVRSAPFQTFALRLRPERLGAAGAAVMGGGRARVQTIAPERLPRLTRLLDDLEQITGVAALLSSSFNRSGEPTVETVEDAVASFVLSRLDRLVIGDVVAERTKAGVEAWLSLELALPAFAQLVRTKGWSERRRGGTRDEIRTTYAPGVSRQISRLLADLLDLLDEPVPLGQLLAHSRVDEEQRSALLNEILVLTAAGLVRLRPAGRSRSAA